MQFEVFGNEIRRGKYVIPDDEACSRLKRRNSHVASMRRAAIVLADTAKMQWGSTLIIFQHLGGRVSRAVVDYNHFKICYGLLFQMTKTGEEYCGPVVCRDNDANRVLRFRMQKVVYSGGRVHVMLILLLSKYWRLSLPKANVTGLRQSILL